MKRRKWTGEEKLRIVLTGLSEKIPIAELCAKYQISQGLYYRWRDQLLEHGAKVFDEKKANRKEQRLGEENKRLKQIIGDLTIELKKNEFDP